MTEYIDRRKIMKLRPNPVIRDEFTEEQQAFYKGGFEHAKLQIIEMPGEDVRPVRHGWWECECEPNHKCSCCKHTFQLYQVTNYCPNCGAQMLAIVPEVE